jgi:hypothetical protein
MQYLYFNEWNFKECIIINNSNDAISKSLTNIKQPSVTFEEEGGALVEGLVGGAQLRECRVGRLTPSPRSPRPTCPPCPLGGCGGAPTAGAQLTCEGSNQFKDVAQDLVDRLRLLVEQTSRGTNRETVEQTSRGTNRETVEQTSGGTNRETVEQTFGGTNRDS